MITHLPLPNPLTIFHPKEKEAIRYSKSHIPLPNSLTFHPKEKEAIR